MKLLGQRDSFDALGINQYSGNIIDWLPDDPTHVMMAVNVVEESTTGSRLRQAIGGMAAQRVDIYTAAVSPVTQPNPAVRALGTDGHGAVRLKAMGSETDDGYVRRRLNYYALARSGGWHPLASVDLTGNASFEPDGFDESGDWLYVLKPLDGRKALYKVAVDGTGTSELVFAHPIVDVDGVVRLGKYGRPVAVEYTVDAEEYEYFDPALLRLHRALSKALVGSPNVRVISESWDGSKRVVLASSDTHPGTYYLYDPATHELNELLPSRPLLAGIKLSESKPIKYPAADGTMIPAYLTLPLGKPAVGLKAIVMPHGGPSARDTGGFDWLAQYFVQLGYAVIQPNFRGSSGYGEAWYRNNGFKSWQTAIGDVNDSAKWLVAQHIADPTKLAIVGWSYGGYAALQANVLDPQLYKAIVAIAPVTDLAGMKRVGRRFSDSLLVDSFIGEGPHVTAGSPARNAAAIKAPVMLFSGDQDLNVDVSQARTMDSALATAGKVHEIHIYPGLDHQIEDSDARTDMLRRSAAFLDANLR